MPTEAFTSCYCRHLQIDEEENEVESKAEHLPLFFGGNSFKLDKTIAD